MQFLDALMYAQTHNLLMLCRQLIPKWQSSCPPLFVMDAW